VLLVPLDRKEQLDQRVLLEQMVQQVPQVLSVQQVPQAQQGLLVQVTSAHFY
jgi:hypothetical protein